MMRALTQRRRVFLTSVVIIYLLLALDTVHHSRAAPRAQEETICDTLNQEGMNFYR